MIVSCNKTDHSDPELTKLTTELKELGDFENVAYEFVGEPNENGPSTSSINVTFSNTDLENLNVEEFGKEAAKKIYNLNTTTRSYGNVWISIKNINNEKTKEAKILSNPDVTLEMDIQNLERNLVFRASELKE